MARILLALCPLLLACVDQQIEDRDRALFVTVKDLEEYGIRMEPSIPAVERRIRYLDRSLEIEYELDASEDAEQPLYLSSTAGLDVSEREAKVTYAALRAGFKVGVKWGGLEVSPDPEFYSYGDDSYFALLLYDGRPAGNVFLMREGARTYSLVLSGIYFDEISSWKALVEPRLASLRSYQP